MIETFLNKLKELQFEGEIRSDLNNQYERNVSRFAKKISLVLWPNSPGDLNKIIAAANTTKTPLYPVSCGKNWGFGSRTPVQNNSVILDLQKLNKIREVNLDFGYAIIEPGVTQADLARKLVDLDSEYFLDVTGSGAETSIIGNALERGVAYSSLRADTVYNFEVLLGDGTTLKTGFDGIGPSSVNALYSHGLGPGLHHLFFQSNYGIVVSATVKLQKRKTHNLDFKLSFSDDRLPLVFENLRILKQDGILKSICRTGDFARSFETMAPLLNSEYKKLGITLSPEQLLQKYRKFNAYDWTSFGRIDGSKEEVQAKKKQIQKHFANLGKLQFFTERSIQQLTQFSRWFRQWDLYCSLKSSESLRLLSAGQPTNAALQMTSWNGFSSMANGVRVDESPFGFILVVPLCPLTGKHAVELVSVARAISRQFNINLGITLNTMSDTLLEGVISLKFLDDSEGHRCMKALYGEFKKLGYWPYRLNTENMGEFTVINSISTYKRKPLYDRNLSK